MQDTPSGLEPSTTPAPSNQSGEAAAPATPEGGAMTPPAAPSTTLPTFEAAAPQAPQPEAQPNTSAETSAPAPEEPAKPECTEEGELDLSVIDPEGNKVPNLLIRLVDRDSQQTLCEGRTNAKGHLPPVKLKLGTVFLVYLGTDAGHLKHIGVTGKIESPGKNWCSLACPRTRFEFSTLSHRGTPGTAEAKKQATIQQHNQTPEATPNISRNPQKAPQTVVDRDAQGHPKVIVKDGLPNMYGQHNNNPAPPNVSKSDLEKVQILMDFAKKQVSWEHIEAASAEIIAKMKTGTYQPASVRPQEKWNKSQGKCAKYVKIALWYAGYSHNNGDIAPGVSPAKQMGPYLEAAGFKNITNQLPDARWAAPGDVIVYKKIGAPEHVGHIDIRTYDGYASDFFETYLPVTGYEIIGIYRKYHDPMPEKRMRAFLKILRSREAETVLAKYDDSATYRALPFGDKRGLLFDGFQTHPFENVPAKSTPSGAYGITCGTWHDHMDRLKSVEPKPNEPRFSPQIQDRIAVALMEYSPQRDYKHNMGVTALGLIRIGKIEQAIELLRGTWSCLPGAKESRGYKLSDFMASYERNILTF